MEQENFYQKQYFDQLTQQIESLRTTVEALSTKVDDIRDKVIYIYAFAAAFGIFSSFLIDYVRTKFFGAN